MNKRTGGCGESIKEWSRKEAQREVQTPAIF